MIISRLTDKAQTTIPRAVRAALGLGAGDAIAYRIEGECVVLTKAAPDPALAPADDPFATFEEWDTDADRRAYADL
jgi:antitoxin PrlF